MIGESADVVLASLTGPNPYRRFHDIDAAERAAFTSAYEDLRTLIRHCAWRPGPDFGPDSLAMAELTETEVEVRLTEIEQFLIRKDGRYSFHDLSLASAREAADRHAVGAEKEAGRQRLYDHLSTGLRKRLAV